VIDQARDAVVVESGESWVGEFTGSTATDDDLVTVTFGCSAPAYRGWQWAVVLSCPLGQATPTVCEVVLVPGSDALVAPAWVPWSERLRPGDLGVGDVLPTPADDPRLVAGFANTDDLEGLASLAPMHPGSWEVGLGRVRVLSAEGRDDAASRWHEGEHGPQSAMARAVDVTCAGCGFLITIGGPLGQAFGICANEMSPADGMVVSLDFGCGAHSQVEIAPPADEAPEDPIIDELGFDEVTAVADAEPDQPGDEVQAASD